jgi:superoxide dismutase, Cu-Zn family
MGPRSLILAMVLAVSGGCGGRERPAGEAAVGGAVRETLLTATMINRSGEEIGTAVFRPSSSGLEIALEVRNLPPGEHALHVHENPSCDPPAFESAGSHFNPEGRSHGLRNPNGPHAGDLPNILVRPDSSAQTQVAATRLTLGGNEFSVLRGSGTALVIHAGPDDYMTDPAGNAGDRIACGVISP